MTRRGRDAVCPELGRDSFNSSPEEVTTYEVFVELFYVNGLFLMRTWHGQVFCDDPPADRATGQEARAGLQAARQAGSLP